jgi:DNA-binding MarR family transcriptional regulator
MDMLNLENQMTFPLYAAARGLVKKYIPLLAELGLTYTQYITMMVLWKHHSLGVKKLGEYLYLNSGTLTPVLKKLEKQGFIIRQRSAEDERHLIITLTAQGESLKEKVRCIPQQVSAYFSISREEGATLRQIVFKILDQLQDTETGAGQLF